MGIVGADSKGIWKLPTKLSTNGPAQTTASPRAMTAARPSMLGNLLDLANLITMGGLALAVLACWLVLSGRPSLALALAASAIVMDYLDGWVARRTVGRNPAFGHFGAHLDCFADYINKGVFPVLLLMSATDFHATSLPVALIYLMAIAVRYSYEFVPEHAHIGLSPDYVIVFLCLLQLAALGSAFVPTLMAGLVVFAALAVAPFPSPKFKGRAVIGFCLFLLLLAAILLSGGG